MGKEAPPPIHIPGYAADPNRFRFDKWSEKNRKILNRFQFGMAKGLRSELARAQNVSGTGHSQSM